MEISIYTDGGAIGNPGPAASAFVVYQDSEIIYKEVSKIGNTTNNVAEYTAVIMALEWMKINSKLKNQNLKVEFYSDSQLLVNQLNGLYKIRDSKLKLLVLKVKKIEQELKIKIFHHLIPREKNRVADALVKSVSTKKF